MKCRMFLGLFLLLCAISGAQDFKWQKTLEIVSNGIVQGPPMDLKGSKWRIRYTSRENTPILVEMFSADGSARKELIRSHNKQTMSGSKVVDAASFDKGFLRIQGSYLGWKIVFEQFVDEIKGWELLRLGKKKMEFEKQGIWCGDGGESIDAPISANGKCLRMSMATKGDGRLKVEILDESSMPVAATYLFEAGAKESWLYVPGGYKLQASSKDSPWIIEINALK